MRNHSWNPHPLLKERGSTFQKLVAGQRFWLEREDKPEKRVDVEMRRGGRGRWHCFYYFTVQFSHICCVWGESNVSLYYFLDLQPFELAMQDFHPRSHSSLLLKPGIICTFLIHSGILQKMLTALFNLV